ncbi:unnamed protein product [Somion occarium]|uniref:Adenylate kinase n=1 Tax=Somion occarium TaxID=3059160 RepID=A0ABP1DDZ2_9APHY
MASAGSTNSLVVPPLRGDARGQYRVHIVGNSGAGKSTLGKELAALLGVPFIALDSLFWQPGWKQPSAPEFRETVQKALDQADKGWVVDGNFNARLGTMISEAATDIIWLDPPLVLYFPRLCLRTILRLLGLAPPCAPGCPESFKGIFLSSDSILWFSLSMHWKVRKAQMQAYQIDSVWGGGNRRRIGGWGGELRDWKRDVEEMIRARGASGTGAGGDEDSIGR